MVLAREADDSDTPATVVGSRARLVRCETGQAFLRRFKAIVDRRELRWQLAITCRHRNGVRATSACGPEASMPAVSEPSLLLTSSLEEDGFEPSVPREREKIGVVDGIECHYRNRCRRAAALRAPFSRGFCCSKLAQPLLGFLGREEGVGVWRQLIQYSPRDCEVAAGVALDRNGARRSEHSLPANRRPGLKGT